MELHWKHITPEAFDAVFEKYYHQHRTATFPEDNTTVGEIISEARFAKELIGWVVAKLLISPDVRVVRSWVQTLFGISVMLGWHLRNEQANSESIEGLMSDRELQVLRDELDREFPVRRSTPTLPSPTRLFLLPPSGGEQVVE